MIGVDLCKVSRIRRVYERYGNRFSKRFLHPGEILDLEIIPHHKVPTFIATRWATKEALYKAFGDYRLDFRDVQLVKTSNTGIDDLSLPTRIRNNSKLCIKTHGKLLQLKTRMGINDIHVSISHDGDYVVAFVTLDKSTL